VTTIAGALDIHVYDIARVEALSGPQGTLYGASSLSGTMRIITNKPDPRAFSAGYDVKGTKWGKGDGGGSLEGFVNIPINDKAAVRLVGFYQYDGGYISNVPAQNTFQRPVDPALQTFASPGQPCPVAGSLPGLTCYPVTITNANVLRDHANAVKTYGGRAALKVDLNDNWTITPQLLYQHQDATGNFSFDPKKGDLNVGDFRLERNRDQWYQSALTVEGKVSNFDLVYSGGWFERRTDNVVDYSEYSVAYDQLSQVLPYYASYVSGFTDNKGNLLDPTQYTANHDKYTKMSHEFRISTPQDARVRGVLGAFYQRQTDNIRAEFRVDNLGSFWSVDGQPGIIYLSQQDRTDRDYAVFTEWNADITDSVKITGGIRKFWVNNTLYGFFGYNKNLSSAGEAACFTPVNFDTDRPCVNTDKKVVENGETHKVNLQYQIDPDRMVYTTYSTGFRPGGNNRRVQALTYGADRLTNIEVGWKTSWLDRRLRWNGAVFVEKWKGAQTGIQGQSGITSFVNAGDAKIEGWEGDISVVPVDNLTLAASWTNLWKAQTTTDFCKPTRVGAAVTSCTADQLDAPAGTQLPITPKFKGNVSARYRFAVGGFDSFAQIALVYQGSSTFGLEQPKNSVVGDVPSYTTVDVSVGTGMGSWKAELYVDNIADKRGEIVRNVECADALFYCDQNYRVYPTKPRMIGLKFGQKF